MFTHGNFTKNRKPALRALFSFSVNTAADWKSLYLNNNDTVNVNVKKGFQSRYSSALHPHHNAYFKWTSSKMV